MLFIVSLTVGGGGEGSFDSSSCTSSFGLNKLRLGGSFLLYHDNSRNTREEIMHIASSCCIRFFGLIIQLQQVAVRNCGRIANAMLGELVSFV